MICCALAAFLILSFTAALKRCMSAVFGARPESAWVNESVAWSLARVTQGDIVAHERTASTADRWRIPAFTMIAVSLVVVATVTVDRSKSGTASAALSHLAHVWICGDANRSVTVIGSNLH